METTAKILAVIFTLLEPPELNTFAYDYQDC